MKLIFLRFFHILKAVGSCGRSTNSSDSSTSTNSAVLFEWVELRGWILEWKRKRAIHWSSVGVAAALLWWALWQWDEGHVSSVDDADRYLHNRLFVMREFLEKRSVVRGGYHYQSISLLLYEKSDRDDRLFVQGHLQTICGDQCATLTRVWQWWSFIMLCLYDNCFQY